MNKERNILSLSLVYVVSVLVFYVWLLLNHLSLYSFDPVFFNNRLDLTGNYFLLTGFHLLLIQNSWLCGLMDALFVLLPVALFWSIWKCSKSTTMLSVITAAFNLVYAWFYSVLGVISIEVFTAWIFTPLVFVFRSRQGFIYAAQVLRLIFLVIFFSTAMWKIRAGGFFNPDQMSAILFRQHTALLAYSPESFFASIIRFLIEHKSLAQILYQLATLLEAAMLIGFFTRKYDRWLLLLSLIFIVFDYFLMEINYFSWLPMVFVLYITHEKRK